MTKTTRKILTFLSITLFILLLCLALPLLHSKKVYAAEQTAATKVPLKNFEMTYVDQAWNIDSEKLYKLVRIEDSEGNETEKAIDAGEYTVYVTPAEGCVWEDGTTDEKACSLTIKQATLTWQYGNRLLEDNSLEIEYQVGTGNVINKITAVGISAYGVFIKNINENWNGLEAYQKVGNELVLKSFKVEDVGEYVFKLQEYTETNGVRTYLYKNYTNPEFDLKISKVRKNIGEFVNMQWKADQGGSFVNGTVYEYRYKLNGASQTVYLAQKIEKAPYEEWEDWTCINENGTEVKRGILAYRRDLTRNVLLEHSYGVSKYFNAEYSGTTQAKASGKYETVATISPVPNVDIYYEPDGTLNTEVTDNHDGTYTVKKTWYIAYYFNEFLDKSSADDGERRKIEYTFPQSWSFGSLPERGVNMPYLAHGDELAPYPEAQSQGVISVYKNGKWLKTSGFDKSEEWVEGEDDVVTFTLKSGDAVICEDQPRSKYDYYVNKYMPVGKYNITFTAKDVDLGTNANHIDWWNGYKGEDCGSVHIGITRSYDFEVFTGALLFDDSALNFFGKDDPAPFRVDAGTIKGNFENFFGVANSKVELGEGMITKSEVEKSETYWSTVADKYYGELELKYHLKSADDLIFYPASADIWKQLITVADTYNVYYTVNLSNYQSVPQDIATDFAKQYFTIELYGSFASGKASVGMIILYICLSLLLCAIVVIAVIFFVLKRKRKENPVEGGEEPVQLGMENLSVAKEQPAEEQQPERQLRENPDEEQQTIAEAFEQPVKEEKPVVKEPAQPEAVEEPVEAEPAQPEAVEEPVEAEPAQPEAVEEPVVKEPAQPEAVEEPVEVEPAQPETVEKPVEVEPAQPEAVEEPVEVEPAQPEKVEEPVEVDPAKEAPEQPLVSGQSAEEETAQSEIAKESDQEESAQPDIAEEPAEKQPEQPIIAEQPEKAEHAQPVEEQVFANEQEYIDHIMEEAQEEYDAEHKDDPEASQPVAEEQPVQPEQSVEEEPMQYSQYAQPQQPQYNQFGQPVYPQPQYNQFGQPVYPQPQYNQFGQPIYPQPQYNQFGQPIYPQPQYNQFGQPVYPQPQYGQPAYPQQPVEYQPAEEDEKSKQPKKPENREDESDGEDKA